MHLDGGNGHCLSLRLPHDKLLPESSALAQQLPARSMHPLSDEGMLEGFRRRNPLVRVQRQALLQQVDEVVELPGLGVVHAARCGHEAGPQVARRLDHWQGSDGRLHRRSSQQMDNQSDMKSICYF